MGESAKARFILSVDAEGARRGQTGSMLKNWTPLAIVYLVLAIVGLVGTWSWNIVAIIELRDFVGDWVNSGPAVSSLTVDLLVAAVAGSILIIVEGRRVGMKWAWVLLPLSSVTAFAFTFPLFLALRERRLVALRGSASAARVSEN